MSRLHRVAGGSADQATCRRHGVDGVPPPATVAVSSPTSLPARCILIVDDNRDAAMSLASLMEITGNETHTAHDGQEAVEAAARLRPDVILLDIGLPKLNGFEACRQIRAAPWGKSIVIVALTGWGQADDRRKSLEAGFDGHLVKPADYDELTRLLDALQSTLTTGAHRAVPAAVTPPTAWTRPA